MCSFIKSSSRFVVVNNLYSQATTEENPEHHNIIYILKLQLEKIQNTIIPLVDKTYLLNYMLLRIRNRSPA